MTHETAEHPTYFTRESTIIKVAVIGGGPTWSRDDGRPPPCAWLGARERATQCDRLWAFWTSWSGL